MEQIVNPLLTDPESDPTKRLPNKPYFEAGWDGTTSFVTAAIKPEPAESAYIVLLDSGQIFAGMLDRKRAEEMTENIGGLMVELPIAFDARRSHDAEGG